MAPSFGVIAVSRALPAAAVQAAAEYGAMTSSIGSRLSRIWRAIEIFVTDNTFLVIGVGVLVVIVIGWLTTPRLR